MKIIALITSPFIKNKNYFKICLKSCARNVNEKLRKVANVMVRYSRTDIKYQVIKWYIR